MQYNQEDGFFTTRDGCGLYYTRWIAPGENPAKTVVFHHGLGEHSHRYKNLLEQFSGSGVSFYSFDMRGHGQSGGKRGVAISLDQLDSDLDDYFKWIGEHFEVRNPILYGHSLGGLVVLNFAQSHPVDPAIRALAATGPSLKVPVTPLQNLQRFAARMVKPLFPDLRISTGIRAENLSHDPDAVKSYQKDPLVHGKITLRLGLDIFDGGARCIQKADSLHLPLFLAHGEADRVTDPNGTREFYSNHDKGGAEMHLYEGRFHEIFNETTELRARPLEDFQKWCMMQFSRKDHGHST